MSGFAPALSESLAAASNAIGGVLSGSNLNAGLEAIVSRDLRAAAQDLSFKALRGYGVVDAILDRLLERPLTDPGMRALLLAALAELLDRPQSAYVVVHQAVEAAALIGQPRAKKLVNAVLRNFLRRVAQMRREIEQTETGRFHHPAWWIRRVREANPGSWQQILRAAGTHSPMTLRVNVRRIGVESYMRKLAQAHIGSRFLGGSAVLLERPRRIDLVPGFAEGEVSVQDWGAQVAAPLLAAASGMRVLDACAAPGGKAAHILELADCELLCVDIASNRAMRIEENLSRLCLGAMVCVGDATQPQTFWDGRPFDRILLDVPCSGSGVVRRHPDILWLRRESDLGRFAATQRIMLEAVWPLLNPGGTLLYATCSVFPEENGLQIRSFLERHSEALAVPIAGIEDGQILPRDDSDGFYYALLKKNRT